MNKLLFFAASMLTILPAMRAQDCSNWANYDFRGTYTQSGSGYIDLSKAFPGSGLPAGWSPYFVVGAVVYDGRGAGTGWLSFNMGGNQLNAQFVDYTYSVQPNCSIQVSFRLKLTDLGITSGLQASLKVPVPKPGEMQLRSIHVGTPFGKPADPSMNVEEMHRISIQ